jgi:LAS superfamily LD-carboxypeptidase LdcB
MKDNLRKLEGWPTIALGVAVLVALAFLVYRSYGSLSSEKSELLAELELARQSSYDLMKIIDEREATINSFQNQIESLVGTVATLDKLAKTDEELLAKYSKVYFLNENYEPSKLVEIKERFLNKEAINTQIHAQVWPYLERLLIDANGDGQKLLVASAFRSFGTQAALKSAYKVTYGSGANAFSADQGYSEHQLGTAVDFTTENLGSAFSNFGSQSAYQWLKDNAHKYGFVLSYPPNNAYYKFEPWHWRYVGVKLATRLHADNMNFYDWDQREIDRYLVNLFD